MKITLSSLLTHPKQFFIHFTVMPPQWLIAYCGYYLVTFVESVGNVVYGDRSASIAAMLLRGIAGSFFGAFFNLLFFGGLWMHLGAKILGGRAPFKTTVQAVGYGFFFPGLLGLATVPLMLYSTVPTNSLTENLVSTIASLLLQLIAGLAALVYAAIGTKHIHELSWRKTIAVMLWMPILLIGIGLIASLWMRLSGF